MQDLADAMVVSAASPFARSPAVTVMVRWMAGIAVLLTAASFTQTSMHAGAHDTSAANGSWQLTLGRQLAFQKVSSAELESHCSLTLGSWCQDFYRASPVTWRAPPLGGRECLWNCTFVGVCDATFGWCRCPAGWQGDACDVRMKRPCSQHFRQGSVLEPYSRPNNYSERGEDLRCAGLCDEDIAMCFCNETMAQGTLPIRFGRPMGFDCQPNESPLTGEPAPNWGDVDADLLFGEDGWCQAERPKFTCPCYLDGRVGAYCELLTEHFCINQCNGHGKCYLGWCQCHSGWYGHDCAFRMEGTNWTAGLAEERPWVGRHASTPASRDPEPGATRSRPLIYIYELPPIYNQLMLQYRVERDLCVIRVYGVDNITELIDHWMYNVETGIHEMLAQSVHRTLDPEEADFFYIPVYVACMVDPVLTDADFPWFHGGPAANRAGSTTNMMEEAWSWLRAHHPYWDRHGGRDHIILSPHDEGSCHVPAVLRPAIVLSLWGRKDLSHTSLTAYGPDNYTYNPQHPVWQPADKLVQLGPYPCYNATKDLVIPAAHSPSKYAESPLFGAPEQPNGRDIFGFFKGAMREGEASYSHGIRQKLAALCKEEDWWGRHKIWIGSEAPPGLEEKSYSALLASSMFCFALPGDGWSARFEDGIVHGCIPVVILDNVDSALGSLLDMPKFSVRVAEKDIPRVPEILAAITSEEVQDMQRNVRKVWRRYVYTSYRPYQEQAERLWQDSEGARGKQSPVGVPAGATVEGLEEPRWEEDDAFGTIIQFLHSRMTAWES